MVKRLRAEKLEEIIGKPGPFDPQHPQATHDEDETSSNQYAHHKMAEEVLNELGGTYHKRRLDPFKRSVGALEKRNKWQRNGQQSMKDGARYTGEEVEKLGATDTDEKTKSKQDDVDINPKIPSAQGETTKNTTIKERKEK